MKTLEMRKNEVRGDRVQKLPFNCSFGLERLEFTLRKKCFESSEEISFVLDIGMTETSIFH